MVSTIKAGLVIGGFRDTPLQRRIAEQLLRQLELAITLGREQTAMELVRRIADFGGVRDCTVTNNTFAAPK